MHFLQVTQILVGLICLCFGTIVCSVINISELKEDVFSSFKAGYPFWGAVFVSKLSVFASEITLHIAFLLSRSGPTNDLFQYLKCINT